MKSKRSVCQLESQSSGITVQSIMGSCKQKLGVSRRPYISTERNITTGKQQSADQSTVVDLSRERILCALNQQYAKGLWCRATEVKMFWGKKKKDQVE